jgi:hypothetical protein
VWRNRYHRDPDIVGKLTKVDGLPAVIVGVMPRGMRFPIVAEVWVPLSQMPGLRDRPRSDRNISAFGRLADGVSLAAARSELESIGQSLSREYPAANENIVPSVVTFHDRWQQPDCSFRASSDSITSTSESTPRAC